MLPAACIHIVEDGIGLENKSRRQGAAPFTLICNLHKIVDTIYYLSLNQKGAALAVNIFLVH